MTTKKTTWGLWISTGAIVGAIVGTLAGCGGPALGLEDYQRDALGGVLHFLFRDNVEDGQDGMDGTNGVDGERGDRGGDGSTGPMGPEGAQGASGLPGVAGEDGADGQDGETTVIFCQDVECPEPPPHCHEIIDDPGNPHDQVTGPAIPCDDG